MPPSPRDPALVVVGTSTIRQAEAQIFSCEACDATANTPFHAVLESIARPGASPIAYFMPEPARCQRCRGAVFEDTFVRWVRASRRRGALKRPPKEGGWL
jgi:hypothetical protein